MQHFAISCVRICCHQQTIFLKTLTDWYKLVNTLILKKLFDHILRTFFFFNLFMFAWTFFLQISTQYFLTAPIIYESKFIMLPQVTVFSWITTERWMRWFTAWSYSPQECQCWLGQLERWRDSRKKLKLKLLKILCMNLDLTDALYCFRLWYVLHNNLRCTG